MFRKSLLASLLCCLIISLGFANTYVEKVVSVDPKAKTITFTVDKKDKTFKMDEKAVFMTQVKAGKRLNVTPLKDGLKAIKVNDEIIVSTELKDGEEVVTKIVVSPAVLGPKKVEPKKVEPKEVEPKKTEAKKE